MSVATLGFMLGCWAIGYVGGRGWRIVADFVREAT